VSILQTFASAAVGYLFGSISVSRLIARRVNPKADISKIEYEIPGSTDLFVTDSVSATAARHHLGARWGCLTAILDMAKVLAPTLAVRLLWPEAPYYLATAAFGLVGHDWPLFARFKGGRGESPIIGGLLAIDPLGLLITTAASSVTGIVVGHILVFRWAWLLFLIPWFWFRLHSWPHVVYMVMCNIIYWYTMSPELIQYAKMGPKGISPTQEEIADFFAMGKPLGRLMDRYSILAFIGRLRKKTG
jgi:acyl phosphate:glycerol-3-phosphate acyltransferase